MLRVVFIHFLLSLFLSPSLYAQNGTSALEVKSSLIAATGNAGFLLPPQSYLTNISPIINDLGDISFNVVAPGDNDIVTAIFFKDNTEAQAQFKTLLPPGLFASELNLNDRKEIMLGSHDGSSTRGIYSVDSKTGELKLVIDPASQTYALSNVSLNDEGVYSYRRIDDKGEFSGIKRLLMSNTSGSIEVAKDNDGKVSYLFSHELKGDYLIYKLRYGPPFDFSDDKPDMLWIYNYKKEIYTPIAADRDSNPSSKIIALTNQYTISKNGNYAFWAVLDTKKTVLYAKVNDTLEKVLVLGDSELIEKYDMFSPSMNNDGNILIRGMDKLGKNSLFVYHAKSKKWFKVIHEGAEIVNQSRKYNLSNSRGITFIGRPMINNNNEIVFNSLIKDQKTGELIEGIVKIDKLVFSELENKKNTVIIK